MGSMLETMLLSIVHKVPLEVFVFVASFIEEVAAPIPSASVLLVTGALAAVQERTYVGLIPLILLAALGKTLGAFGVYHVARALGHTVIIKYGQWFGVTEEKVMAFGERLNRTEQSFLFLTLLRAIPIVPSALISVGGGILRVRLPLFLITTLIGTIFRDSFFLHIGFIGTNAWQEWVLRSVDIESYVQLGVLVLLLYTGVKMYRRTKQKRSSVSR